jgi:hypothetical protein
MEVQLYQLGSTMLQRYHDTLIDSTAKTAT